MIDPISVHNYVRSLAPGASIDGMRLVDVPGAGAPRASQAETGSFARILADSIQDVNELQTVAGEKAMALATGESSNIHSTLLAMQKAEISMKMLMAVRNKILSAYQEVMRLQI